MKLAGWEKTTSAEQYRKMIEAEYHRLKSKRAAAGTSSGGLEEVKLRLFLSLLEKPASSLVRDREDGGVTTSSQIS